MNALSDFSIRARKKNLDVKQRDNSGKADYVCKDSSAMANQASGELS